MSPKYAGVFEFAGRVHHDFVEGLKSAKIWGSGVFDGQSVGREHVLHDKDVVERVTFWGLSDRRTWRLGQHPLLFDSKNQRKPAYAAIVDALLHPNPDLAPPR